VLPVVSKLVNNQGPQT